MKKLLIIMFLLSIIVGCKKYPEDGNIHLLTVKERLCRGWCATKYGEHCDSYTLFRRDGSYMGAGYYPLGFNGKWKLIDHKNKIRLTNTSNNMTYDLRISMLEKINGTYFLRLKNDTATFDFIRVIYD